MQVSHETIYRTLFVQSRGVFKRELLQHLRRRRADRRVRGPASTPTGPLADAISIRERPASVDGPRGAGPLGRRPAERDASTPKSRRSSSASRATSCSCGSRRKPRRRWRRALARQIRTLPAALRRSLTWDRGRELAAHRQFTVATDVQVYFCDPHSPWQRGSNENTNGLLRQYLPRGTDLSRYSQAALNRIARRTQRAPTQNARLSNAGCYPGANSLHRPVEPKLEPRNLEPRNHRAIPGENSRDQRLSTRSRSSIFELPLLQHLSQPDREDDRAREPDRESGALEDADAEVDRRADRHRGEQCRKHQGHRHAALVRELGEALPRGSAARRRESAISPTAAPTYATMDASAWLSVWIMTPTCPSSSERRPSG